MTIDKGDVRREYAGHELARKDLAASPVEQFSAWLTAAERAGVVDATAMTLATVDDTGQPAARIVLLKAYGEDGFTFYTDMLSAKGLHMRANPRVCLLFYWRELERQVRITGSCQVVGEDQARAYFAARPRESQISAAASRQSVPVKNRLALEAKAQAIADEFRGQDIPKPERWGGYRVIPDGFEFWQGRVGRLHDRFVYRQIPDQDGWHIERLQP